MTIRKQPGRKQIPYERVPSAEKLRRKILRTEERITKRLATEMLHPLDIDYYKRDVKLLAQYKGELK